MASFAIKEDFWNVQGEDPNLLCSKINWKIKPNGSKLETKWFVKDDEIWYDGNPFMKVSELGYLKLSTTLKFQYGNDYEIQLIPKSEFEQTELFKSVKKIMTEDKKSIVNIGSSGGKFRNKIHLNKWAGYEYDTLKHYNNPSLHPSPIEHKNNQKTR